VSTAAPIADVLLVCSSCKHECRVPVRLAGRKVPCQYCRRLIEVPGTASAANEDRLVGQIIGGCTLVRRLGAGALGVVYEAQHGKLARQVAVKMLSSKAAADPQLVSRFEREARISAAIEHDHVVGVHDCGHDRGVHFLVMEYIAGTTLAGLVEANGPLPWQEAAKYIRQVAAGLDHLATHEIVHRDVKPANVLVTHDGKAKLADLGLAKQLEADGDAEAGGLTIQGVAMGSPAYMAPEQVRSARDAGTEADIYSLGASFYYLLAGVPPHEGRNGQDTMMKVLRETPRPIQELVPTVPPGIAALVHRMLEKDPADRPATAAAAIAEIDAALAAPAQVKKVRRRAGAPRAAAAGGNASRTRWLLMAGVVAALGVAAGLVFWLRH
jgi:eukaryotic-like serine/threonine-protein kinase